MASQGGPDRLRRGLEKVVPQVPQVPQFWNWLEAPEMCNLGGNSVKRLAAAWGPAMAPMEIKSVEPVEPVEPG